jgi:hypothetical protein
MAVGEGKRLTRQLNELDRVLDFLERMNFHQRTEVPISVSDLLLGCGLPGTIGERPMTLMPRVLNLQQDLRRQLASASRMDRKRVIAGES